jgi:rhamnosyl/mannosyltransferase
MSEPLAICHLGKYYPPAPGGIETHVRTLAQAQAKLGAKVTVFCFQHQPGPTSHERDGDVEVVRFRRLASVAKLDVSPEMYGALHRVQADVIHMQAPNPAGILAVLAARLKLPVVVTYQSDVVRQKFLARLFQPLETKFYKRVKLILSTSPTYPPGSRLLSENRDRLLVLPMGIDLQPYLNPAPEHLRAAEALKAKYPGPLWVACGRLVYYKGLPTAIQALAHTQGTLLIVGDGPDQAALEAEAQQRGVRDRVVFVGGLPYQDIVPYYLAATAFWFPSGARSEAFGLVQVEAMACGCPVINTNIPNSGVAWVSRDNESGLTIPVGDVAALAEASRRLIADPALHARLAAGARQRAISEFDAPLMAARSLELYNRILQGPQVTPEKKLSDWVKEVNWSTPLAMASSAASSANSAAAKPSSTVS